MKIKHIHLASEECGKVEIKKSLNMLLKCTTSTLVRFDLYTIIDLKYD